MDDLWSWVLAGLGIVQIYLTGKKRRIGWVVGFITSCMWATYAVLFGAWGFLFSAAVFGWIHVKNWLDWGEDKE